MGDESPKKLQGVDQRLSSRYQRLVAEHMKTGTALSAGLKALPDKVASFASTQAAWRFYANESVTLPTLQAPLTEAARAAVGQRCNAYALCIHEWFLLSNVTNADKATLALWYYWRWQIESCFKLMKSAGHQLESWQQESALAIAKRLLVASMACVTVWAIAAAQGQDARELRALLIKLSGRPMKKQQPYTYPALLDGLWVLLAMLELMESYTPQQLDGLKKTLRQFV